MTCRRSAWLFVALSTLVCVACIEPGRRDATWTAFGEQARADVHTRTARDADELVDKLRSTLASFERKAGPDGELGRLNRGAADGYQTVDDNDFYRLVLLALDYARATHGAFDPTVAPLIRLYTREDGSPRAPRPTEIEVALNTVGWQRVRHAPEARAFQFAVPGMRLDLGGIAKGFALDIASRAFARPGSRGGVLSVGNNYYVWGRPPDAEQWTLDVGDPRLPGRGFVRIAGLSSRGVAASSLLDPDVVGDPSVPARIVVDPRTGELAASGVTAAVAIADSAGDADALSTALFVMGAGAAGDLLSETRNVEAILLVAGEGDEPPYLLASATLRGRLELAPELSREVGNRVRYLLPPEAS